MFDTEQCSQLVSISDKYKIPCIHWRQCDYVDINLTNYEIDCIKKASVNDPGYDKLPPKKDYRIAVVIPNYNYEHTIGDCIKSVLRQKYKNYEILVIDDVSTDNSVKIAKSLLRPPHKVIELKQKRYSGGARNEALLHLSDKVDYVLYLDSDDWLLDENVLDKINNKLQCYPDVLFMGLSQSKAGKITTAFIPRYQDKYEALKGWSGCGKVVKKSFLMRQECLYNEGTLKEDKNQHCKLCIYMDTFNVLKEPLYVWNKDNLKSITTIRDEVLWRTSTIRHWADTIQLALSVKGRDRIVDEYMQERIRLTKNEVDSGGDRQW